MYKAVLWFDRLRDRLRDAVEEQAAALPGLADLAILQAERDLERVEVLLIAPDIAERLVANGDAPEDLKASFDLPFESVFFLFEEPVALPEELGRVEGIHVVRMDDGARVRAWFEERRPVIAPRYGFALIAGQPLEGPRKRITDLLYWLSGYISSPGLLAIRHNRPADLVRRRREAGRPLPTNYYTFAPVTQRRKRMPRGKPGEPKPRFTEVSGHFRRAHWHGLASGRGKVRYPTTWVRSHRRRVPVRGVELREAA